MKKWCMLIVICALLTQLSYAQIKLTDNTTVLFASVDQSRQILTAQDDFVRCMSPFDRAARMKTNSDVSEKDYLDFVGNNILSWSDAEKQKVISSFQKIQTELETLALPFPKIIVIIKTTGNEEGRASYTRANAIILPQNILSSSESKIRKTIAHELFHILSRANPDLRDKLYESIGFMKTDELPFPPELKSKKITNPDAPMNDHCIRLKIADEEHWAIPVLFSSIEKYDVERGGEFFNYLQFRFLLVERIQESSAVKPIYENQHPKLVDEKQISGFFDQVGNNTKYIIHPEEILADNFALLVLRKQNVPSPEILTKMENILKSNGSDRIDP